MDTRDLIKAIAADTSPAPTMRRVWQMAGIGAVVAAALMFALVLAPRADLWAVAHTPRFLFKFVFAGSLALAASRLLPALSRPGVAVGLGWLLLAPVLLMVAVISELVVTSSSEWATRLIGHNVRYCLTFIPLIGLLPLAAFLTALRYGATTRPRLAGAISGMAAGGLAAFFYAAHCIDDSPLFVAVWYTIAISGLTALGALLGPRIARW